MTLNLVSHGPINYIPVLVQIMAWRRPGDKPLSEPMMVSLPTHICVTRPQWVNKIAPIQEHLTQRMWIPSLRTILILLAWQSEKEFNIWITNMGFENTLKRINEITPAVILLRHPESVWLTKSTAWDCVWIIVSVKKMQYKASIQFCGLWQTWNQKKSLW